jgi:hypothetical protein
MEELLSLSSLLLFDIPFIWTGEAVLWLLTRGKRKPKYRSMFQILFYRKGETPSEFFIPFFVGLFFWLGLIGGLFAVFGPFPQIHQL